MWNMPDDYSESWFDEPSENWELKEYEKSIMHNSVHFERLVSQLTSEKPLDKWVLMDALDELSYVFNVQLKGALDFTIARAPAETLNVNDPLTYNKIFEDLRND